ncbi:MAG: hypothetical protein RLN87_11720, partial [Parasphingopyxis sp.]|uniref:hypothetical protein n=1 Tax=Parasphingopyxis sp. TaxID=1920299 RepID=UPI0032EE3A87
MRRYSRSSPTVCGTGGHLEKREKPKKRVKFFDGAGQSCGSEDRRSACSKHFFAARDPFAPVSALNWIGGHSTTAAGRATMAISNRKPGRSRWLEGTAMALVSGGILFTSTPAYADCFDAAPDFGDTVTCDGDPPNPSRTEFLPVAGAAAIGPAEIFPTAGEDATWLAAPESGDFNTAANWDPASTPGSGDTAFFDTSSITSLTFSADTTVGGWTFNSGANSFDFTIGAGGSLIFDGAGIVINGGRATIVNNGNLLFSNASTAGSAWITNNDRLSFSGNSTAGSAVITNNAGGAVDFSA